LTRFFVFVFQDGSTDSSVVANNTIWNTGGAGVIINGGAGNVVVGNVIGEFGGGGVNVNDAGVASAAGTVISRNVFYRAAREPHALFGSVPSAVIRLQLAGSSSSEPATAVLQQMTGNTYYSPFERFIVDIVWFGVYNRQHWTLPQWQRASGLDVASVANVNSTAPLTVLTAGPNVAVQGNFTKAGLPDASAWGTWADGGSAATVAAVGPSTKPGCFPACALVTVSGGSSGYAQFINPAAFTTGQPATGLFLASLSLVGGAATDSFMSVEISSLVRALGTLQSSHVLLPTLFVFSFVLHIYRSTTLRCHISMCPSQLNRAWRSSSVSWASPYPRKTPGSTCAWPGVQTPTMRTCRSTRYAC